MICSIDKCKRPVRAKGICNMHRQRIAIHGDPDAYTAREDRIKHGHSRKGHQWSREYESWASMMNRCKNPRNKNFYLYGGRGIKVTERWHDFRNFLADMGPRPAERTLDRYPNRNGNYEPGNCRWATDLEQGNNTARNVRWVFEGREQTVAEWAREVGLKYQTLADRVRRHGWTIEEALTIPKMDLSECPRGRRHLNQGKT